MAARKSFSKSSKSSSKSRSMPSKSRTSVKTVGRKMVRSIQEILPSSRTVARVANEMLTTPSTRKSSARKTSARKAAPARKRVASSRSMSKRSVRSRRSA